jgi:hypothetical protein
LVTCALFGIDISQTNIGLTWCPEPTEASPIGDVGGGTNSYFCESRGFTVAGQKILTVAWQFLYCTNAP